ncbi:MAG: MFS transporter [Thaumarchaeota archaeon]|nr:MFS transporter [Nitrososphaerota archaeon]
MVNWFERDQLLLQAAYGIRAFIFGYLNIAFPIYMSSAGLDSISIGLVITGAILFASILSAVVGVAADRYGRKKMILMLAGIVCVGSVMLLISNNIVVIIFVAIFGLFAGGPPAGNTFGVLQQVMLADVATAKSRNSAFAVTFLISSVSAAGGSLMAGLPDLYSTFADVSNIDAFTPLFIITAALAVLYASMLLPVKEVKHQRTSTSILPKSTSFVAKISGLAIVDGFGTALVAPLLSYWFVITYNVPLTVIGMLFFVANLISAAFYLLGPKVAAKVGVVRAIVWLHVPSDILLILQPLAPDFGIAAVIHLLRATTSIVDIPLRQSFIMGVASPEERASVGGFSAFARNISSSASPAVSGYSIQVISNAIPFFLSGAFQLANDLAFYRLFRNTKPPEETAVNP